MNILDFIYSMSFWQWVGVIWLQLVLNWLILSAISRIIKGIYEIIIVNRTMKQMENLKMEDLKALQKHMKDGE